MTLLDPNWFYSSLAQSAASVVGLMGAVLATRMQQQIVESREQRFRAEGHLNRFAKEREALVKPLREYTEHSAAQVAALQERLPSTESSFAWPVWYAPFERSQPASVERTERMLGIEQARHEASKLLLAVLQKLQANSLVADLGQLADSLAMLEPGLPPDMSARVGKLREFAEAALQETSALGLRAQTRTGWVLWLSLVGICCAGVIWPLSYLTAYAGEHRSLMLGAFALCLLALLGYMFIQLKTLMHLANVGPVLGQSGKPGLAA